MRTSTFFPAANLPSRGLLRIVLAFGASIPVVACDEPAAPAPVVQEIRISVATGSDTIGVGGTLSLTATVIDRNGAPIVGRSPSWESADTSVVTVSATGTVSGTWLGTAWVRASLDGVSDSIPVVVSRTADGPGWVDIDAGLNFACGVWSTGEAFCWGTNSAGQLGNNSTTASATPVAVAAPAGVRFSLVRAGGLMTCGVSIDQDAYCWGRTTAGGIGNSTTAQSPVPLRVEVPAGVRLASVDVGSAHACALSTTGDVYCWGHGTVGKLGDGSEMSSVLPVRADAPSGTRFSRIGVGGDSSCGVSTSGEVWCWGGNESGQVGDGGNANALRPVRTTAPTSVSFQEIASGGFHHCAAARSDALYCWGRNLNGQLGNDTTAFETTSPVRMAASATWRTRSVAGGLTHSCAALATGRIECWGANDRGQLGAGAGPGRLLPVAANTPGTARFDRVAAGFWNSCALSIRGEAYCWGAGTAGQLGNGESVDSPVPVAVLRPVP